MVAATVVVALIRDWRWVIGVLLHQGLHTRRIHQLPIHAARTSPVCARPQDNRFGDPRGHVADVTQGRKQSAKAVVRLGYQRGQSLREVRNRLY